MKTLKEIKSDYIDDYSHIPKDDDERYQYLLYLYKVSESDEQTALEQKKQIEDTIQYDTYKLILYEEPVGKPRPRFKRIKGKNHVYSGNEYYRKLDFKELLKDDDIEIAKFRDNVISTPCIITYDAYLKTPHSFNKKEKILAELKVIRPIVKPDWDNIGKEYSDLYNKVIWLDDALVISATVNKYYSLLPRVEITLTFTNAFYNKYQYRSMKDKVPNGAEIAYFSNGKLIREEGGRTPWDITVT